MKTSRLRTLIPSAFGLVLFIVALFTLRHELRGHSLQEIVTSLLQIPADRLVLSFIFVILAYSVMTLYDTLAFYFLNHKIPYRSIALASFVGHALANSVGLTTITSGSVRYRFYSTKGISTAQVLHVVAFGSLTFWLGFCGVAALLFATLPPSIPPSLHLPFSSARPLGFMLLALLLWYLLWSTLHSREHYTLFGHGFRFPTLPISLLQILVSGAELTLGAATVYVLLPHVPGFSYPHFLSIFLLAQISGLASQVPGGFGVFESIILALLPLEFSVTGALASLFVFRLLFNLLPLCVATVILGLREFVLGRRGACPPCITNSPSEEIDGCC